MRVSKISSSQRRWASRWAVMAVLSVSCLAISSNAAEVDSEFPIDPVSENSVHLSINEDEKEMHQQSEKESIDIAAAHSEELAKNSDQSLLASIVDFMNSLVSGSSHISIEGESFAKKAEPAGILILEKSDFPKSELENDSASLVNEVDADMNSRLAVLLALDKIDSRERAAAAALAKSSEVEKSSDVEKSSIVEKSSSVELNEFEESVAEGVKQLRSLLGERGLDIIPLGGVQQDKEMMRPSKPKYSPSADVEAKDDVDAAPVGEIDEQQMMSDELVLRGGPNPDGNSDDAEDGGARLRAMGSKKDKKSKDKTDDKPDTVKNRQKQAKKKYATDKKEKGKKQKKMVFGESEVNAEDVIAGELVVRKLGGLTTEELNAINLNMNLIPQSVQNVKIQSISMFKDEAQIEEAIDAKLKAMLNLSQKEIESEESSRFLGKSGAALLSEEEMVAWYPGKKLLRWMGITKAPTTTTTRKITTTTTTTTTTKKDSILSREAGLAHGEKVPNEFTPVHSVMGGLYLGLAGLFTIRALQLHEWDDYLRYGCAGLMVGIGSVMGSGCTSGHGISGNARFSIRSFVATTLFIGCGMAVAVLTKTTKWLGVNLHRAPKYDDVDDLQWIPICCCLVGFAIICPVLIWKVGERFLHEPVHHGHGAAGPDHGPGHHGPGHDIDTREEKCAAIRAAMSAVNGCTFVCGLAVAGMTDQVKVATFLDVSHKSWNGSLPILMAVAIPLAFVGFKRYMNWDFTYKVPRVKTVIGSMPDLPPRNFGPGPKPLDNCWQSFTARLQRTGLTWDLVLGSCTFGCGWGLAGLCPGPALAVLGAYPINLSIWTFVGSMLLGMIATGYTMDAIKGRNHLVHHHEDEHLLSHDKAHHGGPGDHHDKDKHDKPHGREIRKASHAKPHHQDTNFAPGHHQDSDNEHHKKTAKAEKPLKPATVEMTKKRSDVSGSDIVEAIKEHESVEAKKKKAAAEKERQRKAEQRQERRSNS
eukprot:Selendium_serpulae@DN6058_c0_g1_i1.p1